MLKMRKPGTMRKLGEKTGDEDKTGDGRAPFYVGIGVKN
jgi:hypothetical protein